MVTAVQAVQYKTGIIMGLYKVNFIANIQQFINSQGHIYFAIRICEIFKKKNKDKL